MSVEFSPRSQCIGKRTYLTKREAKRVLRRAGLRHLRAYRCPHCGKYHLGTKIGTEKRRRAV